jgi:RHS repeat-associated protein
MISFRWGSLLITAALAGCSDTGAQWLDRGPAPRALIISTAANQIGRVTSTGRGAFRSYRQYDARGRQVGRQEVLDGASYVFASAYGYPSTALGLCPQNRCGPTGTLGSSMTFSTFSDGETVAYTYDNGGAAQAITTTPCTDSPRHADGTCTAPGAQQHVVVRVSRNARGQTTQVVFGDGTEQDHCYDDGLPCSGTTVSTDLQLNRIRTFVSATGALLQDLTYQFDPGSNVVSVCDRLTPLLGAFYQYDSLNQITSMTTGMPDCSTTTGGTTSTYAYDALGNLITKEGAAQSFGGAGHGPHQLQSAGGLTYSYDADGNAVSRSDALRMVWSAENMPIQVTGGAAGTGTQKFFSAGNELKKKLQGANLTYYLPSMRLENGAPRKLYGVFAERDLDGSLKFYHPDHLGSSTLVTTASGTPVHRAAYKPYGEDRSVAAYTPAYVESFTPKYQFTFKEKEQDGTGFYDYGARLYNPATGRWLSPDSIVADGLNRYAYVANNPLHYSDPTGHGRDNPAVDAQEEAKKKAAEKAKLKADTIAKGIAEIDNCAKTHCSVTFINTGIKNGERGDVANNEAAVGRAGLNNRIGIANDNGGVEAYNETVNAEELEVTRILVDYAKEKGVGYFYVAHSNGNVTANALSQQGDFHPIGVFLIAPAVKASTTLNTVQNLLRGGVGGIMVMSNVHDNALRLGGFLSGSAEVLGEVQALDPERQHVFTYLMDYADWGMNHSVNAYFNALEQHRFTEPKPAPPDQPVRW